MTFDTQDQKNIFLQLIENAQWPGSAAEKIVELKQQVKAAEVKPST